MPQDKIEKLLLRSQARSWHIAIVPHPGQVGLNLIPEHGRYGMPPATHELRAQAAVRVQRMELVGQTALGHHFLQISQMASTHKPLHLGIPRSIAQVPFETRHSDEILVSLRRLCMLLATEQIGDYLPEAIPFGQQLLDNARGDTGHFVSIVLAFILALRTNRSSVEWLEYLGLAKLQQSATSWRG